jgi:hypothetical protein
MSPAEAKLRIPHAERVLEHRRDRLQSMEQHTGVVPMWEVDDAELAVSEAETNLAVLKLFAEGGAK